jgi:hypothetical protein
MIRRCRSVLSALAVAGALLSAPAAQAAPPCFDVAVQYLGRTFFANIGGVDYYTWSYRVTGDACINRGLSHFTLGLCQNYWGQVQGASTTSNDNSDLPNGIHTGYVVTIGNDPTTGIGGIKWDQVSGNQIDKAGEYDTFSFVSPGQESPVGVTWGAKGSTIIEYGMTIGPSCTPVPVAPRTWSQVKSRFTR